VQKLSEDDLLKRRVEIKVRLLLQNLSSGVQGFVLLLKHYPETSVANDLCCLHHIHRNFLLLTSSVGCVLFMKHFGETFFFLASSISCV
jgi:hypothetical protein